MEGILTAASLIFHRSRLMWVHVTLAFLFLPLGIFFTRRFSKKLQLREVTTSASRTVMVTRVPRRSCHKDTMLRHFQYVHSTVSMIACSFLLSFLCTVFFLFFLQAFNMSRCLTHFQLYISAVKSIHHLWWMPGSKLLCLHCYLFSKSV